MLVVPCVVSHPHTLDVGLMMLWDEAGNSLCSSDLGSFSPGVLGTLVGTMSENKHHERGSQ